MNLVVIWLVFITLPGLCLKTDAFHYLLLAITMFYLTYLSNKFQPVKMSLKIFLLSLIIPSIISWYIAYYYNGFLCLNPISEDFFIFLMFFYGYTFIYLTSELSAQKLYKVNTVTKD